MIKKMYNDKAPRNGHSHGRHPVNNMYDDKQNV